MSNEQHSVQHCPTCGKPSHMVSSNGETLVNCPRCSTCPLCGGFPHMVRPEVAHALDVRRTQDPDANVRRAWITKQSYTETPARTWEEWAEAWGQLDEKERMGWRLAVSASLRE